MIAIVGIPTPSPTPIAILSERFGRLSGVSSLSTAAVDVGRVSISVTLVLDVGRMSISVALVLDVTRVLVSVTLVLVLGREVVLAIDRGNAQVSAEAEYDPSGQQ